MNAEQVKDIATQLGADICGIAPVERFEEAPKGFCPNDIYDACKSVVVFAKILPSEPLFASSCVPYTFINGMMTQEVDRLTVEVALKLEKQGIGSVPIPSDDPYEHWEADRLYGRAILSLRHAGYLAGLGILGRNTLLMNEDYGNMIQIGAVLVDAALDGDPLVTSELCPPECRLCIDSCPENALDGTTVDQRRCRPLSNYTTEKGYVLKKCYSCRSVCPYVLGAHRPST